MITVYSKQRCPKCDEVKAYLESKGHVFKSVDITNDLVLLNKFRLENPGAGFPVVEFDDLTYDKVFEKSILPELKKLTIAGDVEAIKAKADTL